MIKWWHVNKGYVLTGMVIVLSLANAFAPEIIAKISAVVIAILGVFLIGFSFVSDKRIDEIDQRARLGARAYDHSHMRNIDDLLA